MDANISDRTHNILRRFRPDFPAYLHWNQFARAADDQYYITTNQGAWLSTLHQKLDAGNRIVIATNSLADAKSHEHALNQAYPNKKIALYSSEMTASVRARHFSDVHVYWGGLDCLIYTPTCSAGVSFELKHFDVFFGFFCNTSCDVPTCRQMIGRVRDISSHEHYVCLKTMGSDKSLPTTPDEVDRMLHDKRAGLYRTADSAALQFSYTPHGDIQFYKSGYYHLWVENMCIANQSTGNFINLFIDQVTRSGASINQLIVADDAKVRASTFREAGREIKAIRWVDIAAAPDMADEEVQEIRASAGQIDITYPMRMQLEKYKLRTIFRVTDPSTITADFVRAYNSHGVVQTFFNLQKIAKYNTLAKSLAQIQVEERSKFENTMSAPTVLNRECIDLVASDKSYSFQTHYIATWLISLCGFKCVFDTNVVLDLHLIARLRGSIGVLNSAMARISFEFKCAIPNFNTVSQEPNDAKFLTKILRMVNRILHEVYGMSITRLKGGDTYHISHSSAGVLFDLTCTSEVLPHIRMHLLPIPLNHQVVEFLLRWYYRCYDGHDHICP
jgi:ribosomal protein L20